MVHFDGFLRTTLVAVQNKC